MQVFVSLQTGSIHRHVSLDDTRFQVTLYQNKIFLPPAFHSVSKAHKILHSHQSPSTPETSFSQSQNVAESLKLKPSFFFQTIFGKRAEIILGFIFPLIMTHETTPLRK